MRYRSIRYLARILGVSQQTARRYCVARLVKARKTPGGGRWQIPDPECERVRRAGVPATPGAASVSPSVLEKLKRLGVG